MQIEGLKVGQVVETNDGRACTIRFIGSTAFAITGVWVGVEFFDASGKNDGSVQGTRYFDTQPNHGMFLRASGVFRIVSEPTPKVLPRPALAKRESLVATLTPRPRLGSRPSGASTGSSAAGSRIGSPIKKPAIGPGSHPRSSISGSDAVQPRRTTVSTGAARPATAAITSGAKASQRLSIGRTRSSVTKPAETATGRLPQSRPSLSASQSQEGSAISFSRTYVPPLAPVAQRSFSTVQKDSQIQELQAKVRVLEESCAMGKANLATLDALVAERDDCQNKMETLRHEIQMLSREKLRIESELTEANEKVGSIEAAKEEQDFMLEMANLDCDLAEEKERLARDELGSIKERVEELELENDVLKSELEEFGQTVGPEERASMGWYQLERENERLREALLRLRDITTETESDLRSQLKSSEEQNQELSDMNTQHQRTSESLLQAHAEIEDLRERLEAAGKAEDMIEELTSKNLALDMYAHELKDHISALEMLKQINDELEASHVDYEKGLHEDLDYRNEAIFELHNRVSQLQDVISDQDHTISRFRDLVPKLQSEMEELNASKEMSENQIQDLTNQSSRIADLNRQLQATASGTKVKTIDMELGKLEARQASEHLTIVQLFLPEALHSEEDSVLGLLRFKRIGFKALLIHRFIKDRMSGDTPIDDEDIFASCDVMDKLTWISAMCDRFVNTISACSLDRFARFDGIAYELEPVERALNGHIDGVRSDELKVSQIVDELHRSIDVISHLAEANLGPVSEGHATDAVMCILLVQSHLETAAVALMAVDRDVQSHGPSQDEHGYDDVKTFVSKTEDMIARLRTAKVIAGKALRALQELEARSLTVQDSIRTSFEDCECTSGELAQYARKMGENVFRVMRHDDRTQSFDIAEVRDAMFKVSHEAFFVSESDMYATFAAKLRELTEGLANLVNATSNLELAVEFEKCTAPWILRSKALQDSKSTERSNEEEISRLREEARDRNLKIKRHEQTMEEQDLKIERLESRMRDSDEYMKRISELEDRLKEKNDQEEESQKALKTMVERLDALKTEKAEWKVQVQQTNAIEAAVSHDGRRNSGGERAVATQREIEALKTDIRYLEAANRFLRHASRRDHMGKASTSTTWLHATLMPSNRLLASADTVPSRKLSALQGIMKLPLEAKSINLKDDRDVALEDGGRRRTSQVLHPVKSRLGWRPMKCTPQGQLLEEELRGAEAWGTLWCGGGGAVGLVTSQ